MLHIYTRPVRNPDTKRLELISRVICSDCGLLATIAMINIKSNNELCKVIDGHEH